MSMYGILYIGHCPFLERSCASLVIVMGYKCSEDSSKSSTYLAWAYPTFISWSTVTVVHNLCRITTSCLFTP